MKYTILLVFVLLFSFLLRVYALEIQPEGFDSGEVEFSYNAYSILHTGKDVYSKLYPLVLESVGDNKLAVFGYWLIPFISVFGLQEWSVRFAVVIASIISLLSIYIAVSRISGKKKIAILTTFFVGILPWHLVLSRMAYETMLAFSFFCISLAFCSVWYRKRNWVYALISGIFLTLSTATYYSVWLSACVVACLWFVYMYRIQKKLMVVAVLPLVMILVILVQTQGNRMKQVSTFSTQASLFLAEQIREDGTSFPLSITRYFHNKITFYPLFIIRNFLHNTSPEFFFTMSDKVDRRFYIPYTGSLYIWMIPFVYLGVLEQWRKYRRFYSGILFIFLFVIFIGSAFSEFGSEQQRTLLAAPILCYYAAIGVLSLLERYTSRLVRVMGYSLWFPLVVYTFAFMLHQYMWHGNVHQAWARGYGIKEMIKKVAVLKPSYDHVVISGDYAMYFYFYEQFDPAKAQIETTNISTAKNDIGHNIRSYIHTYPIMPMECPVSGRLETLYVCRGSRIPHNAKLLDVIYYRDDQPAFIFIELTPKEVNEKLPRNIEYMKDFGVSSQSFF